MIARFSTAPAARLMYDVRALRQRLAGKTEAEVDAHLASVHGEYLDEEQRKKRWWTKKVE
jgi:hypothetical protein